MPLKHQRKILQAPWLPPSTTAVTRPHRLGLGSARAISGSRWPAHGSSCASHFCLETAPQTHSVVMCMQSKNGDMLGINARGRVLPPFVISGQFWEHLGRLLERPWVGQNTLALSWCHIQCAVTSWNFFPSAPFPFHFPLSWTPAAWGPIPNTLLYTSVCIRLPFRRR